MSDEEKMKAAEKKKKEMSMSDEEKAAKKKKDAEMAKIMKQCTKCGAEEEEGEAVSPFRGFPRTCANAGGSQAPARQDQGDPIVANSHQCQRNSELCRIGEFLQPVCVQLFR